MSKVMSSFSSSSSAPSRAILLSALMAHFGECSDMSNIVEIIEDQPDYVGQNNSSNILYSKTIETWHCGGILYDGGGDDAVLSALSIRFAFSQHRRHQQHQKRRRRQQNSTTISSFDCF